MKGPGTSANVNLTRPPESELLVVMKYPKGQKTTPKKAAQGSAWALAGGNRKGFIFRDLPGAVPL